MTCYRHNDDEQFWSNATVEDWAKEMAGMRIITEKYANLTDNSVVGLRSPYLRVGGNNQFTMMEEQAFLYDSSITAPLSNPPLWPYTMYFRMPHRWDVYTVIILFIVRICLYYEDPYQLISTYNKIVILLLLISYQATSELILCSINS